MILKKHIQNCFLLLVPILIWNVLLSPHLPSSFRPDIFWNNIPNWVAISENTLRIAVMIIPVLLVLSTRTKTQRIGFGLYLIGSLIYFTSWLMLIVSPDSTWSLSIWGFTAPAYTPTLWLVGIGLIGEKSFLKIKRTTLIYTVLSVLFVLFHTIHAGIVFYRL